MHVRPHSEGAVQHFIGSGQSVSWKQLSTHTPGLLFPPYAVLVWGGHIPGLVTYQMRDWEDKTDCLLIENYDNINIYIAHVFIPRGARGTYKVVLMLPRLLITELPLGMLTYKLI